MDTRNPDNSPYENEGEYDFTHVDSVARIALYDDLLSAPRVTIVEPAPTGEFIEKLASYVYEQAREAGGTIPYTVIREVSENFIHARFKEATVSILDAGNTVRFADQGPGIPWKDRAQLPGFSSATEPMKSYIRGVGSGLPIVKEYLEFTHGTITIEDNLGTGSVVTISAHSEQAQSDEGADMFAGGAMQGTAPSPQPLTNTQNAMGYGYAQPMGAYQNQGYQGTQGQPQPGWGAYPQQAAQSQAWAAQTGAPYGAETYYPQQAPGLQQAPMGAVAGQQMQPAQPQRVYQQPGYRQPGFQQPVQQGGYQQGYNMQHVVSTLNDNAKAILKAIVGNGAMGTTDLNHVTGIPVSTIYQRLGKLEESNLIAKTADKKYVLTEMGSIAAQQI